MKKWFSTECVLGLALTVAGCTTAPITGRKQVKLVSDTVLIAQSAGSYSEVIAEGPLSTNRQQTEQVRRVGERIAAAVEIYFRDQNRSELVSGFEWEFNLIEQDVPNAWCMPGGKVAFYTGILPFTQDETGMAVVMGHEIAHVNMRHRAQSMSQAMLANLVVAGMTAYVQKRHDDYALLFRGWAESNELLYGRPAGDFGPNYPSG